MFSMCSELTPRAPIPDSRIAQFMQPCHRFRIVLKVLLFIVVSSIIFCQLEKTLCLTNDLTNSYSQPFKLQFMSTNEVFQFKSNEVLQSFPIRATVKWPTTTAGWRWSNPTGAKLLGPNKSWLQRSQLPPGFPKRHRVKYSSHGSYSDFLVNMKQ